jgi:hypothetical protein
MNSNFTGPTSSLSSDEKGRDHVEPLALGMA